MFLVVTFKCHLPLAGIDLKISHQVKNLNFCAAELLVNRWIVTLSEFEMWEIVR